MTDKQIDAGLDFLASWIDKASVGFLIVGVFQPEHMFGGCIGCVIGFLCAGSLKIWRAK